MTNPSFDLTREPWLPCEDQDGLPVEVGLEEALIRAHQLRALADSSPLVTASLHRLLLAIVHRCFGPSSRSAWVRLWERGQFDDGVIKKYLDTWRNRFDLLDAERPFFQVRGLPFEPDPIARLVFERSNYGGPRHVFEHRPTSFDDALSFAEAARGLVAVQAFVQGGLIRKKGEPDSATAAPLNRGAVVFLTGRNLFETLMLNLVVYNPKEERPIPGDSRRDLPAWEGPTCTIERRTPHGWLELLTWQSRRLELTLTEDRSRVNGVVYCVGRFLEGDVRDPMMAFQIDKKKGVNPVRFEPERALFRDSVALLAGSDSSQRPAAVEQFSAREIRAVVPRNRRVDLEVMGLRGDQARILFTRAERLPVLASSIGDPAVEEAIREAVALSEFVGSALSQSLFKLAEKVLSPGERVPVSSDVNQLSRTLGGMESYWGSAAACFDEFMGRIASTNCDELLSRLRSDLFTCAARGFETAQKSLGTSARILKGAANAESFLRAMLAKLGTQSAEESRS
ncbi:MAG TPA: type I-E CRISPR-associated protein Cse1/CasA [Vulgatibacter sp.]|nr:type I-E CRISPR-associated protein Cse1/CasA [Vulgatibacter sp.]